MTPWRRRILVALGGLLAAAALLPFLVPLDFYIPTLELFLGPGVGTAVGTRAGDWIERMFGD